jgi:GntR family transcriptional regulator
VLYTVHVRYTAMATAEPILTIDLESPSPAYRQIIDQIRHYCVDGTLQPGDPLPSVRRLALDLSVHHNTVAEAYRKLALEGWLDVSQGKPVTVLARVTKAPQKREDREELAHSFQRRMRHLVAEMRAQGLTAQNAAASLRLVAKEILPE